jgi:hypothetical protein
VGVGLLLSLALSLLFGFRGGSPLRVYPGPADPAYSVDLPARYRVAEPSYFRWTGREAGFDLPFQLRAPATLTLFYQLGRPSTSLSVLLSGEVVGTTTLFQGASRSRLVLPAGHALQLRFRSEPLLERLRASFFLVEIEAPAGGIVPSPRAVAAAAALPLLVLGLLIVGRVPFSWAAALSASLAIVVSLLIRSDPYPTVRLVERLILPVLVVGGLAAVAVRRKSPWLFAAFLFGLLLRLGIILHPFAYHYDHAAHVGLTTVALEGGIGELWERKEELQVTLNVGEMQLGEKKLAFPYPTLFYIASALLTRVVGSADYAVMTLAAAVSVLEVFVVFWLVGILSGGERTRLYAAWAAAFYPAGYGVLTIALYPSLVAHVAETLAMAFLARGERTRWPLALGSVTLAGSLHAAVPFNLGLFALSLTLVSRKARPLALVSAGLALSFLISYRSFPRLVPDILAALGSRSTTDWLKVEPPQQFDFMGGYLWMGIGILGLLFTPRGESRPFVLSWALSFIALRGVRILLGPAGGAHIKELQWVAPLVCLGIGQGLERARPRAGWLPPTALALLALAALFWVFEHERWLWPLAFLEE